MPQGNPRPGERYLHFKGNQYQIIAIAHHSETGERMVVYQALYGDFGYCVRPYDMFVSEVDREKYPDEEQRYRFTYVGEIAAVSETVPDPGAEPEEMADHAELISDSSEDRSEEPAVCAGDSVPEGEEAPANPWLIRFLDTDTLDEKYEVLTDMYREIDDKLIDDLAVCLDVVIPEGKLEDRYRQLKHCIRTRQKYEGSFNRKSGV